MPVTMQKLKNYKPMENGNIISLLTDSKINSIQFGESVPQLEFDVNEWNRCYGSNRSEHTKNMESKSLEDCNKARKLNALQPI